MNDAKYWKKKWTSSKSVEANPFAKRAYGEIRKRNFRTLLDVGCGDGRDSLFFARKGLSVTAVDFSSSGIQRLRSTDRNIKTRVVDIRTLRFPTGSFDVIYAHLSLHYFTDTETTKIFNHLHRMLRRGGLIFVKCKSVDDPLYGKGKKIGKDIYRHGHTRHFFSKEYMAERMQKFKVLKLRTSSSRYHSKKSAFVEVVATK